MQLRPEIIGTARRLARGELAANGTWSPGFCAEKAAVLALAYYRTKWPDQLSEYRAQKALEAVLLADLERDKKPAPPKPTPVPGSIKLPAMRQTAPETLPKLARPAIAPARFVWWYREPGTLPSTAGLIAHALVPKAQGKPISRPEVRRRIKRLVKHAAATPPSGRDVSMRLLAEIAADQAAK